MLLFILMEKYLNDLLANVVPGQQSPGEVQITGIQYDSRKIKPGNLFVAITGDQNDGHQFIPQAINNGAAAIIGAKNIAGLTVPYFHVQDSRLALARASSAFYDFPANKLVMIGVTGTDGKTTTINLIYEILIEAGQKAGMVSTVNAMIGENVLDTGFHVTTPDAIEIQKYLSQMVTAGLKYAVIETTSHGLQQKRVLGEDFDIGVLTNITHEHLDYHQTFQEYQDSKAILFRGLIKSDPDGRKNVKGAVLNRDDSSYEFIHNEIGRMLLSYGTHPEANFRARDVNLSDSGLQFSVEWTDWHEKKQTSELNYPYLGSYNVYNCLAAFSTTVGILKIDPAAAVKAISKAPLIPGRMEKVDSGQDFLAIVDFAHTPNALFNAINTARQLLDSQENREGKILSVFGSAGLRDRQKRVQMAEISADYSDLTILTAEDPRTESLELILDEMTKGMLFRGKVEGTDFWRITDRSEAIRFAVSMAKPGDIVLLCGKGHEQSMCFGEVEYPWDDRIALRAALCENLGIRGPEMPRLPTN